MSPATRLDELRAPYLERFLRYDELTSQLERWAAAFPAFVRRSSLGRTPEGRELWLLTIGREGPTRPAVWVDANMHAVELTGSSVALAIAEAAIALHLGEPVGRAGERADALPAHVRAHLAEGVTFHVLPRMSPDGAERVLETGQYVRSVPRDSRVGRTAAFWRPCDLDGDGRVALLRVRDPSGAFVEHPGHPGLMLARRLEDEGPFYGLYPEGLIEGWDGTTLPVDGIHGDTETDLNRNFPYGWAPEHRQHGAGPYATSEPESRAVVEFATRHPEIFFWLNLHTYGGCFIRPAGDRPDTRMDQGDLGIYRAFEAFAEGITGYPVVSGFEEFTYLPDTPLAGDLTSFAYAQRGALAVVCELWDFFREVGLGKHDAVGRYERMRPFVHHYQRRTRADAQKVAEWDRVHNGGRVVRPFSKVQHPQLGEVEVGGFCPLEGIWNAPAHRLAELGERMAAVTMRAAAMAPRVVIDEVELTPVGGEGALTRTKVSCVVRNVGYLGTSVLPSAAALPVSEPVCVTLEPGPGVRLWGERAGGRRLVGHLAGWGGHESATPSFARTAHGPTSARVELMVEGQGEIVLRASGTRFGVVEVRRSVG